MHDNTIQKFDPAQIRVHESERRIQYKDKFVPLTEMTFKLFNSIYKGAPNSVDRKTILKEVWNKSQDNFDGNLCHTLDRLNTALLPLGLNVSKDIVDDRRFVFATVQPTANAGDTDLPSSVADEHRSGIRTYSSWREVGSIITSAKKSILIVDSFFSEFGVLDGWMSEAIKPGASSLAPAANSLAVSIYMASPRMAFGSQRYREKETIASDRKYKKSLEKKTTNREHSDYVGTFSRYVRELKLHLAKFPIEQSIYEYPSMPSLRIFVIDDTHFIFGWFPLRDHNPDYVCFYLKNEGLFGADIDVAAKLERQVDIIKKISTRVYFRKSKMQLPQSVAR